MDNFEVSSESSPNSDILCHSNDTAVKTTINAGLLNDFNDSYMDFTTLSDCHNNSSENDLNLNSSEIEHYNFIPHHQRPETYIVPVLFAIIFIVGILGNGTLIRIFIKYRSMRNVPNMYICSLAVGDILVILFCVPFTSTVYTVESWPYGTVVCKFSEYTKDVSIGVSVFTLTALSADRYIAISDPMRKLSGRRATRINLLTILGIWLLSLLIALPSGLFSFVHVIEGPVHQLKICYPFPLDFGDWYPQAIVLFKFLAYYALPLIFIATFHIIMAHHLLLSTRNMPGEVQGQVKAIQARKKVAKMVLAFVVIFAVCFFPSHIFFLWFYFSPNAEFNFNGYWNALRIIGFCLGFINSCINPITLYCVSATFRKYFNQHLFCCCRPLNHRRSTTPHPRWLKIFCCDCLLRDSAYSEGHRQPLHSHSHSGTGTGTISAMKSKSTWDCPSVASHHQIMRMSPSQSAASGLTTNKPASMHTANSPAAELKSSLEESLPNVNSTNVNSFPLVHVQHSASVHSTSASADIMTTSFSRKYPQSTETDTTGNANSSVPDFTHNKCNITKRSNSKPCSPCLDDTTSALDDKYT